MGWVDAQGRHPCGKILGEVDSADGRDSHGLCPDCLEKLEALIPKPRLVTEENG